MIHLGRETPIRIGGQRFTLSRYTRRILWDLLTWADTVLPVPLDYVTTDDLAGLPEPVARLIVRELQDTSELRRSMYNPAFLDLWASWEGRVHEFGLLLRKYQPDLDGDRLGELYEAAALEHGNDYLPQRFLDCMGRMPLDATDEVREILAEWNLLPRIGGKGKRAKPEPEDWFAIDRALIKNLKILPEQVWELTTTEIMVLFASLRDDSKDSQTQDLIKVAIADAYRTLTPLQKLEIAKRLNR